MLLSLLPRISSHAATVFTASRTRPRPIRSFHPRIVGSTFQSGKWTNVTSIIVLPLPYETCLHTFLASLLPFVPLFLLPCATRIRRMRRNVNIGKCASVKMKFFSALCVSHGSFSRYRFMYSVYRIVSFFFFLTTLLVKCYCSLHDNDKFTIQTKSNSEQRWYCELFDKTITTNESFQVVKRSEIIPLYHA